jgi:hypothetical protein
LNRKGFGRAFEDFVMEKEDSSTNQHNIDMDVFMKGFSKEIINLQFQALGLNLEKLEENAKGLTSSEDALHWCELEDG